MILKARLAFSAAFGLLITSTHAQFQVVHDVPNTTTTPELTPLLLPDGNTVTHQWNAGVHLFRKYDESGALLWSRSLPGNAMNISSSGAVKALALIGDETDGVIFVGLDSIRSYEINPPFMDSLVYTYRIIRISESGDLTSALLLKKAFMTSMPGSAWALAGFDAAPVAENGLVISITTYVSATGSIDLVKVNMDGTLAWCRSVGHAIGSGTGPEPTGAYSPMPIGTVAVSASGTTYSSEGGYYPYSNLRLAALDADGTLLWMKLYVYGNTSPMIQYHAIAVDADGKVHGAGSLITNVGRFHIFLRTDANGVLERGDLYRTPFTLQRSHFGLDGQGRRYHRVNLLNPATNTVSHGLLIADTLGNPARFLRRNDEVVLPNNVFAIPQRIDVAGDRLAVSNLLHHEDVDFAFTTRYEALSMFTTDDIAPCLMDDTAFAHLAVPLDPVMTTEVVSNAVSIDVSQYYSIQSINLTLTDPDAELLEPLCGFVVELLGTTGTNTEVAEGASPLVQNTLVGQGDPILLNTADVAHVEVYDSHGALMRRALLNDSRMLLTTDWSPGMYFIHAMDQQGRTSGVGRVVLE